MTDDRRLLTLLLPSESLPTENTMYYRIKNGTARPKDGALLFPAASTLSFDCYYNVFDYATYREHTALDRLHYVVTVRGDVTVSLRLARFIDDEENYTDELLMVCSPSATSSPIEIVLKLLFWVRIRLILA